MKKSKILILLLATAVILTSCITKQDIRAAEKAKDELEDEFEEFSDKYDELEDEYNSLTDELSEIGKSNEKLKTSNVESFAEIDKLKTKIPNPPFQFMMEQFINNVLYVIEDGKMGTAFKRSLNNDKPDENKIGNDKLEFIYELKGKSDSDRYITLTFLVSSEYYQVYDIIIEYSYKVYEEDYDELIQIVLTALVMITEDPYSYEREYFETAEDILEEGDYFNEYMIVEQNTDGEIGTTKIFCRNY